MIRLQTVIKLSGFCNFRCAYCYEFDRLGDPTRMEEALVFKAAGEIGAWCASVAERYDSDVQMQFILHGGEPLILPLDYLRVVIATLKTAAQDRVSVRFAVQTNAYKIKPAVLDLLRHEDVLISVSHDVIHGSRVSAGGRAVETQVDDTIAMLQAEGLLVGGITVVNRVTAPHLERIHRYWRARDAEYRLLPLFRHGGPRNELYGISEEETAEALAGLAAGLLDRGEAFDMKPLDDVFSTALAHIAGVGVRNAARLDFGRTVFVVNTDGGVFDQTATDYDAASRLGDLTTQTYGAIVEGAGVRRLQAADAVLERALCRTCPYKAACNRWPLLVDARRDRRCGVVYHLVGRLVALLRARGVDREAAQTALGIGDTVAA